MHANSTPSRSHSTPPIEKIQIMLKPRMSTNKDTSGANNGREDTPLSPHRAFVVQFKGGGAGRFAGRVEHMVTGQAARFTSAEEMIRFMRRVLRGLDSS